MLDSYRRNDANDPDGYVGAITLVLTDYPRAVVEYVTDPRTGIQAQDKFRSYAPNSGEVKAACDIEMRRIAESQRILPTKMPNRRYFPPERYPGSRANVFVPASHPQFETLLAWSRSPQADECDWIMAEGGVGIIVGLNVLQSMGAIRRTTPSLAVSTEQMRESLFRLAGQQRAKEIALDDDLSDLR